MKITRHRNSNSTWFLTSSEAAVLKEFLLSNTTLEALRRHASTFAESQAVQSILETLSNPQNYK